MPVIVFDADDTLWMNERQYSEAYSKYFLFLFETFRQYAPTLKYVNKRFFQIDGDLYKKKIRDNSDDTWGIRKGRIAESMRLCYEEVSAWAKDRLGHEFQADERARHLEEIKKIGDMPFDFTKLVWRPDALRALEYLEGRGHTLCLLTSYDPELFPKRAAFMEVERFFAPEHIRAIPGSKVAKDFVLVSGWTAEKDAGCDWYAVGNGESDINPALEVSDRWRGFYMPHGSTSKFFNHEEGSNEYPEPVKHFMPPKFEHPRVLTLHDLDELVRNLVG